MLGLGVKVHADTTELVQAEQRVAHFAEHFERHLVRHLSRAIGPTAAIVAFVEAIKDIFKKPEEIDKTARKYGMMTDNVQLLTIAAKEAGLTFEEYMEKAEKAGTDLYEVLAKLKAQGASIIPSDDIKTLNEDREVIEKLWNQIKNKTIHGAAVASREIEESIKEGTEHPYNPPWWLNYWGIRGKLGMSNEQPDTGEWEGGVGYFKNDSIADKPGIDPGVDRRMRIAGLLKTVRELEAQRLAMRNLREMALPNNQLSGWQQMGGFSAQPAEVASKLDDVKTEAQKIGDKIEQTNKLIQDLKDGVQ